MKFCRYGPKGAEKPGLIDADGRVRDLSAQVDDVGVAALPR
ncbi:MAG: 2-hydroxyhepta-2,4-diene-1,7-dioate isomerase, partial [Sphingomonas sp.]